MINIPHIPKEVVDVLGSLTKEAAEEIADVLTAIFTGQPELAAQRARIAAESEAILRSSELSFEAGKALRARGKVGGEPR